jgi:AhpD family alkylhydroperoxidase
VRFDPNSAGTGYYQSVRALAGALHRGPLDPGLAQLVELRVSQVNGCAFCLRYHLGMARRVGVAQDKLDLLAGWPEASAFTIQERAALGLAEQMTRIGDGGRVDNQTWQAAREVFNDEELAALVYLVALINVWNRVNVAVELPDDYQLPQASG